MKPHLISFKICPFVQRSVIVLNEKQVDFDITYINPKEPPDWFKAISPTGKVPVLKIDDTPIFESAVIMEYLDEVNPPSLHPADPVQRAVNRAWIEFASVLIMNLGAMVMAKDEESCTNAESELRAKLKQLEQQVKGPYFNGNEFALADAAYAPMFMRIGFLEQWQPMGLLDGLPKCKAWSERLLSRPSVQNSAVAELPDLYQSFIAASGGYGARRFTGK